MAVRALGVLALLCVMGCHSDRVGGHVDDTKGVKAAPALGKQEPEDKPASNDDAELRREQDEYIADVMAFTHQTRAEVRDQMKQGSNPLKDEWNTWESQGPMTSERIKAFYKQTTNYLYELGAWHLFVSNKRASDLALFADLRAKQPRNILDFGGGVGLLAIPLARAGFDVTIADLDSTTLHFAVFRAERHDVHLKVWKSDVEPAPPDRQYDVILCMDVLEHLPKDVLHEVVDTLIKLKHERTEILISAPFGRTSVHPMHMDLSEDTKQQIERLRTALP